MINLFLSVCQVSNIKKTEKKNRLLSKYILRIKFTSYYQIHLTDMLTQANRDKFIFYQDHLPTFMLLCPLQIKCEEDTYHFIRFRVLMVTKIMVSWLSMLCQLRGRHQHSDKHTESMSSWP